jgi:hypothetical protein
LAAGDLDGDGTDEILAACADGYVHAIGANGKLRWKQDLRAPVWQVATARGDGKLRVAVAGGISRQVCVSSADGQRLDESRAGAVSGVVRLLRAGDFDGEGTDEVAVLPVRGQAKDLVFLELPGLAPRKERIALELVPGDASSAEGRKANERFRAGQQPWNAQSLRTANGVAADLDGDGALELVFNPGVYSLKGGLRPTVEFPEPFKAPSYDQFYKMRVVAVGDLTACPGAETVLLEGCEIRLFDNRGKPLGAAAAPQGVSGQRISATLATKPASSRRSCLLGGGGRVPDPVWRFRGGHLRPGLTGRTRHFS